MKINANQFENYIKNNDICKCKKVLFYGNDEASISYFKSVFIKKLAAKLNAEVFTSDYSVLEESGMNLVQRLKTTDLFASSTVISINSVTQVAKNILNVVLEGEFHNYLVLDGGDLKPASALRKAFESSKGCLAVGCYADDNIQLVRFVGEKIREAGYVCDRDVPQMLVELLPGNRKLIIQELEKLFLYKLKDKRITLDEVLAICSVSKLLDYSEFGKAIVLKDPQKLISCFKKLSSDDNAEIMHIRIALKYLMRIYSVVSQLSSGVDMQTAIAKLTPPLFFKEKDEFIRIAQCANCNELLSMINALNDYEYNLKLHYLDAKADIPKQNLLLTV
jgi:DNA polymerase III subunit delta